MKEDRDTQFDRFVQTSFKLDNDLVSKIDDSILKHKQGKNSLKYTKQIWMAEAIRDKISKSKKGLPKSKLSNAKRRKNLSIVLSERTYNDFKKDVSFHKTADETYTKKKWIIEAIKDKLEKE